MPLLDGIEPLHASAQELRVVVHGLVVALCEDLVAVGLGVEHVEAAAQVLLVHDPLAGHGHLDVSLSKAPGRA